MRKVKLTIEYDGSYFNGFQRQKTVKSAQEVLENVLTEIYKQKVVVSYAGRTDTGVNAKNQVVCFFDNGKIELDKIPMIINRRLIGINVTVVEEVNSSFNPRMDAIQREYEYWLYTGVKNIFIDKYMCFVEDVNYDLLTEATKIFEGIHDFNTLCTNPKQYKSTVLNIEHSEIKKERQKFLGIEIDCYCYRIRARSFLYHMIRIIVGLLLELNNNKISINQYSEIIKGKISYNWKMAPAKGLFLSNIQYSGGELKDEK